MNNFKTEIAGIITAITVTLVAWGVIDDGTAEVINAESANIWNASSEFYLAIVGSVYMIANRFGSDG